MGTSHPQDQAVLHSKDLGKCTNTHDDLEVDGCPLFDLQNPRNRFCGACGCHLNFHLKINLDSRDDERNIDLDPKHKVFLSHSGRQKDFVEQLCVDLERFDRYAFFDKEQYSLPIGENFPSLIFRAIDRCHVGVAILSDDFFTSKWPMMELTTMVDKAVKEFSFKIIPVFLNSSLDDIRDDSPKFIELKSLWGKWAQKIPERISVEKWEASLNYLRQINGIKGSVHNKLGEVQFRQVIVDAVCIATPPEVKLEVSHIQGSSRLCEVIENKIFDVQQKDKSKGVCLVGLYGMGGIGKTSICKVLYNELFTKFRGRVCHAELEKTSKKEVLQHVVERLTDTNPKLLNGLNIDELRDLLKRGIGRQPVFLALDNMSDTDASMKEVEDYLLQSLMLGSIVIVTARSLNILMRVINKNDCLEMPELEVDEARSLFIKSSKFDATNAVNEQIIRRCVERCHFKKGNDSNSYQYHPLALDVLGRQLRGIDPRECKAQLDKINEDIFNRSNENKHPIFSILRTSFDLLSVADQLLFMDVALFSPKEEKTYSPSLPKEENTYYNYEGLNVFEWLGMVHGIASVADVMDRLERLKRKSLLESLGDGINIRIGMNDLWRAFCVAETENGELGCQRWVYETKKRNELFETTPFGIWQNVKRMAILDLHTELRSLERANFAHFPNVTVLKLSGRQSEQLVLDLSPLIHLKSLEVRGGNLRRLVLQGLPGHLIFLSLIHSDPNIPGQELVSTRQLTEQIGNLKKLQHLQLISFGGSKLPDMRSMLSLQVAIFRGCHQVDTLSGLSSNLRVLDLQWCEHLRGFPGVADLVALEELTCKSCERLERLPTLQKLTKLRKLDIADCPRIIALPGLSDLVALEELYVRRFYNSYRQNLQLPDMCNLTNLQVLQLGHCCLVAVPGFDNLKSLREVAVNFREVVEKPNLLQLTNLQKLEISGWSLAQLRGLNNLAMLHYLDIHYCSGVDELPIFPSLISLQSLSVLECEFKDVSGLSNLSTLERLHIKQCKKLERIPDLQGLTRLKSLEIMDCALLRGWDCTFKVQDEGSSCRLDGICEGDSKRLTRLQPSIFSSFGLIGVNSIGPFAWSERLDASLYQRRRFLILVTSFGWRTL